MRGLRQLASAVAIVALVTSILEDRADAAEPTNGASRDPQDDLHPVTDDDDPHDEFAAFPLLVPHDKHWVRAGLEVGAVVIVGYVDYLLNTGARGGLVQAGDEKWALRYDWSKLRGKFVGNAYELDANRFGTNYVAHPVAGSVYYQVARSNHLTFGESYLFSVLGSSLWEYFGEIRERVSVNDMIVTPAAGTAIGESMMQLAGFFDRGRRNVPNRVLSFLFAPVKFVNDVADGSVPRRDPVTDALGFPTEPWHRFDVHGGVAATTQGKTRGPNGITPRATYTDVRFGLELAVANLPGYRSAGRHARLFDDGNVSSLFARGAVSDGRVVDFLVGTRIVPIGFYFRDARIDRAGHVRGHGALVGLRMSFEYGVHEFDRDGQRPRDLVSVVSPLGIAAEHTVDAGPVRITTGIDVYGAISGVAPYALGDWRAARGDTAGLPTAVRNNGYYHSIGVGASPFLELQWRTLRLEGRMRADTFRAIEGLDEANAIVDRNIDIADRRAFGRAAVAWEPRFAPLRLAFAGEMGTRAGQIGSVHASRDETSLAATVGARF